MIDPTTFRVHQPDCIYNPDVHTSLEAGQSLTEDEFTICNPVVLGLCFGTKTWGQYKASHLVITSKIFPGGFAIDRLQDIVWNNNAFESLILSSKQKTLIYSLVNQHTQRAGHFDDIIVGKGQGIIGLLSGRPGCGKTLTAEAVAEITHRLLYTIGAGELGVSAGEVEIKLIPILELARTWNAVLLLDEADVFLQCRDHVDLSRNAVISVFLRQLEYFQGILILTTNRIAEFDPAFESTCTTYVARCADLLQAASILPSTIPTLIMMPARQSGRRSSRRPW